MRALIVQAQVRPECLDEFVSANAVMAATTMREEPGCLRYDLCELDGDSSTILFYEVYADDAAFDAHQRTPHFSVWQEVAQRTTLSTSILLGSVLHTHGKDIGAAPEVSPA